MKRKLSRLIKKFLVYCKLDKPVADQFQRTGFRLLRKLIPDRTFYNGRDIRTVSRQGVVFKLNPADFSQWQVFAGDNFAHVEAALKILAPNPEGLILDIGANCGHVSLVLAKKIAEKKWNSRIVSYEPNPRIYDLLRENLQLNPGLSNGINLVNKGVGKEQGTLELQIPLRNSGAGSLVRNYEHEPHEKYEIEIVSVDDSFLNNEMPVKFMKIDVENFEYFVLTGATQTINKYKPAIYLEISGKEKNARNEIVDFLRWFGKQEFEHKIFIAGNHDFYFEKAKMEEIKALIPKEVIYLNDSGTTIDGINIWGSPVTPWFFNWAFNRHRGEEIQKHWDLIPDNTNILMTHGPVLGIHDTVINSEHVGCRDLLQKIKEIKPKVHVCGHIHEGYGAIKKFGTEFINACVLNESYELVNSPVVFDVVSP